MAVNGPKVVGETWVEKDKKYFLHGMVPIDQFARDGSTLYLDEAHGMIVRDIYGREYIDATAGAISVNVGYGRKEVAEAAYNQMVKQSYCPCYVGYVSTMQIRFVEKLAEFTPEGLKRFFLCSGSGSEAVDSSIKLARFYWQVQGRGEKKSKIISREYAYHGVNVASGSCTGMPSFHKLVGPLLPDIIRIGPPYCYHCPWERRYPNCNLECAKALEETIEREGKDTVAAFIGEPILGAGGIIVPPPEYWLEIRRICTDYDVLYIDDEVMTGFGRTGKNFAIEHWEGVKPDMMLMSKGIVSSALPLSAVAISDKVYEAIIGPHPFPQLYTTSGHPVACAAALKNLEIIERENLVENSAKVGKYLLDRLQEFLELPYFAEARGLGLFCSLEIVKDKATKATYEPSVYGRVLKRGRELGLIFRIYGSSLMLAPVLSATTNDIDAILDILAVAVKDFEKT